MRTESSSAVISYQPENAWQYANPLHMVRTFMVPPRFAAAVHLARGTRALQRFVLGFTGRENVYLNGAILGFSRQEMDERFDEIATFADWANL